MGKYEDLQSIQKLKDSGSITEKEFELEKYKILSRSENKQNNTTEGVYTASLVLGICAFLLGSIPIFGTILSIVALIVSTKARKKLKVNGETKGIVTAGFVLSIVGLAIGLLLTFMTLGTYIINTSRSVV